MKNFKRLIALLLALIAVPMCFFACEEGGQEEGTIDPNDTTDGLRIDINVRDLPSEDGELGVYFVKTGDNFRVEPGTTLLAAVQALCEERGATFELDTLGAFMSFTFDGATIISETKSLGENKYIPISFEVTVNGNVIKTADIATYALNHNDLVEIRLVKGEEFVAKE